MSNPADHEQVTAPKPANSEVKSQPASQPKGDAKKPLDNDTSAPKHAPDGKPSSNNTSTAKGRSTTMSLSARYDSVPGTSNSGPTRAKTGSALWFDPLTITMKSPRVKTTTDVVGVTLGRGQEIGSVDVPLHEHGPAAGTGTGMISAQLKYTSNVLTSYSVSVVGGFKKGSGDDKKAEAKVKEFLGSKKTGFARTGDLEMLQEGAAEHVRTLFPDVPDVKVTIAPLENTSTLADAGHSDLFFKAETNPSILLHVPVVVVAEQVIASGGASTKSQGSDVDLAASHASDDKTVDINRNTSADANYSAQSRQTYVDRWRVERVATLKRFESAINTIAKTHLKNTTDKIKADGSFHENWKHEELGEVIKVQGDTSNRTAHEESGEKDDKNFFAYLEDIAKAGEKIVEYVKPTKWIRQIGIGLGITKELGNVFAVRGKIKYHDIKDDTTKQGTSVGIQKSNGAGNHDITQATEANVEQKLQDVLVGTATSIARLSATATDKAGGARVTQGTQSAQGHVDARSSDDYRYNATGNQQSSSARVRANQSTLTQVQYSTTVTQKTTQPVLLGSVVDGEGEIKSTPFTAPGSNADDKEPRT